MMPPEDFEKKLKQHYKHYDGRLLKTIEELNKTPKSERKRRAELQTDMRLDARSTNIIAMVYRDAFNKGITE